jgi:nicotinate-nucleotide pyrophosphorylase (carboxylating)
LHQILKKNLGKASSGMTHYSIGNRENAQVQRFDLELFLRTALAEDIGSGDITSALTIPAEASARFAVVTRQPIVVAGLEFLTLLFALIDPAVTVTLEAADGDTTEAGARLATLEGPARALLAGERTALNLLQHLSGIATLTRSYVEAVAGTKARITDTRKTTPGLRFLQKYAVKIGGGYNHRMGLYDGILIKDNHLKLAGGIASAVKKARAGAPAAMAIEVECDTLQQVDEAIAAKSDIVLLDNMDVHTMAEAVTRLHAKNIEAEASGNVSLATVAAIARTGVDVISIGKLTHSAPAVDIGLDAA